MRSWHASIATFDWSETHTGLKATRNAALREALAAWLTVREQQVGFQPPPPAVPPARDAAAFQAAYQTVGQGGDFVRIHRLREALGWSHAAFDRVLAMLAAAYYIELHGGDPGSMTAEDLEGSYRDAHGTLYLTVSWREE